MTSDHVLAVMALMREVETPAKSYRHSVRRAAATATDSPENDAARSQGERALRDIEQAVRLWVATHPEKSEPAEPSEWVDGDPLLEAIAAIVTDHCHHEGVIWDDPQAIAAAVAGPARAVTHREAADRINALPQDYEKDPGRGESATLLRQWVCPRCKGSGQDPENTSRQGYGGPQLPDPCSACQFVGRGL